MLRLVSDADADWQAGHRGPHRRAMARYIAEMPASAAADADRAVALWLLDLIGSGASRSAVDQRLTAAQQWWAAHGHPLLPAGSPWARRLDSSRRMMRGVQHTQPLHPDQLAAAIAALTAAGTPRSSRDAALVMTAVSVMGRASEMAGCRAADLVGSALRIRRAKGGDVQLLDVGPDAEELLDAWSRHRRSRWLWRVGPDRHDQPPHVTTLTAALRRGWAAAGLPGRVSAHALRATGATILIRRGVPVPAVMHRGGWTSWTAFSAYIRAAAADRIDLGGLLTQSP